MEWGAVTSYFIHIVCLNIVLNYLRLSVQSRCDHYGCEENEQDGCSNGLLCKCKQGLERPSPQIPLCVGKCSSCLLMFATPTLSPFPFAKYRLHCSSFHVHFRVRNVNFGFRQTDLDLGPD